MFQLIRVLRFLHRRSALLAVLLSLLAFAPPRLAAQVSVRLASDPRLVLDSNRPCTDGPGAAMLSYRIRNTGPSLSRLTAQISGMANGIALGVAPSGVEPDKLPIGTLASGGYVTLFWFITYPCTIGTNATLTVTIRNASGTQLASVSNLIQTYSMISSQAGGNLEAHTLNGGPVIGAIVSHDVTYSFGGASTGDTYNLQPAGTQGFDSRCFQLVSSEIVSSAATAVPVGVKDSIFFQATQNQGGSKINISVRFSYRVRCINASTKPLPYASQMSGGQLKYSANFSTFVNPTFTPPAVNPLSVTKSASPTSLTKGDTVTYTVSVVNGSTSTVLIDSIADVLPAGVTFQGIATGSAITAANSSSIPATGSTGTQWIVGVADSSWSIAAGGTLVLKYRALVQDVEGTYVNRAYGYAGWDSVSSSATSSITLSHTLGVAVTPDGLGSSLVKRLPGTGYSQEFTVTSGSSGTKSYDLLLRLDTLTRKAVAIDSITGSGVATATKDSARVSLTAGQVQTYTAWYTVPSGDTAQNVVYLRGRVVQDPAVLDDGFAEVRRAFPQLTLTRSVSPTTPAPGGELTYTINIANVGELGATGVALVETVASQVAFKIGSVTSTLPSGVTAAVSYSNDGGTTFTYTPLSGGCAAATGHDGCVNRVRWSFTGTLAPGAAASATTLTFLGQLR